MELELKKRLSKKGELTTAQIVTLIILVVSFVVVLIFIFLLNPTAKTDQEICRNSVVLKGKSSSLIGDLDCKTGYTCISGGGECKGFVYSEKVEVELNQETGEANKNEVMKAIADKMAECWWMFGEGQVDFGTKQGSSVKCSICSTIAFDEKIRESVPEISYSELYNFLSATKKQGDVVYSKYLYNLYDMGSFSPEQRYGNVMEDSIKTSEKYSIMTGMDDNISPWEDVILRVSPVPTEKISQLECSEFLTRA